MHLVGGEDITVLHYQVQKKKKEQGKRVHRDLRSTPLGRCVSCSDASSDVEAGKLWPAVFEVSLHVAIDSPTACKLSHILSFGVTIPAVWAGQSTASSSGTYH